MTFLYGDQPLTIEQAKDLLKASNTTIDLADHAKLDKLSLVKLAATTGNIAFAEIALNAKYNRKSSSKGSKGTKPKPCNIVSIVPNRDDDDFIEVCNTKPTQATYGAIFLLTTMQKMEQPKTTLMQIATEFLDTWHSKGVLNAHHKFTRGYSLQAKEGEIVYTPNVVDIKKDRGNDPFAAPLYTTLRQGLTLAKDMKYVTDEMVFNWSTNPSHKHHERRRYHLIGLTERGRKMLDSWDVNEYVVKQIRALHGLAA